MKKTRVGEKNARENKILARFFREKLQESGLSMCAFARESGIDNASVHLSYLFSESRGLSFFKAVRIAIALGVDLGEVQRACLK